MRKRCCRRASGRPASGLLADPHRPRVGRPLCRPRYCEPITDLYESEGWTDVMPEPAWSSRRRGKASSTRFRLAFTAETGSGTTNKSWTTTASKSATRCRSTNSLPRPTRSRPLGFRPWLLATVKGTSRAHRRSRTHCSAWRAGNLQCPVPWRDCPGTIRACQRSRRDLCQDARLRQRGLLGLDMGRRHRPRHRGQGRIQQHGRLGLRRGRRQEMPRTTSAG